MSKRYLKRCFIVIFVITLFLGCSTIQTSSDNKNKEKPTIKMAYVNWSENIAMANLMKYILEEKLNYKVSLNEYDISNTYQAIASGKEDVFMDAWLPVTHEGYMKQYKDKIKVLGTNYEGAKIGLIVPTYVNINSIEDVNQISKKVNNQIVGINGQAGIMQKTNLAITTYDLNTTLKESSEAEMMEALSTAISKKKPIIITGWAPHWMFSKWDLKFLDDPEMIYGHVESIHTISSQDFTKNMPKASKVFKNFKLNSEQMDNLMEDIENKEDSKSTKQICKAWVENHKDLVNAWLKD